MKELKLWLEDFITYTEKKIQYMKNRLGDHRNLRRFEAEVSMAKKTLDKMRTLTYDGKVIGNAHIPDNDITRMSVEITTDEGKKIIDGILNQTIGVSSRKIDEVPVVTRFLVVHDNQKGEKGYMETVWTDEELSFRWSVISEHKNKDEARISAEIYKNKMNIMKKMEAIDFLIEIRDYLEAKYGKNYDFSPTMIDPVTFALQMAIMEKTSHGVERRFDLFIKDRGEQIKNKPIEQVREELIKKWEASGFLDGLKGVESENDCPQQPEV